MGDKQDNRRGLGSGSHIWTISADETLQGVLETPGCPPLVQQSLTGAMTWQARNRRLVSRALVSPSIAPQWTAALLALGASVTMSIGGEQQAVPFEALFQRRVTGDVLTLQVPKSGVKWGEAHVGRTLADEPIVAATAGIEAQDGIVSRACVALIGTSSRPVELSKSAERLVGSALGAEEIRAVSRGVEAEAEPVGDYRGSVEYRRAMAGILTRRALQQCREQEAKDG